MVNYRFVSYLLVGSFGLKVKALRGTQCPTCGFMQQQRRRRKPCVCCGGGVERGKQGRRSCPPYLLEHRKTQVGGAVEGPDLGYQEGRKDCRGDRAWPVAKSHMEAKPKLQVAVFLFSLPKQRAFEAGLTCARRSLSSTAAWGSVLSRRTPVCNLRLR